MIDITSAPINVHSRSVSPENPTGEKGRGGMIPPEEGSQGRQAQYLGTGWKTNPFIFIEPGETAVLGDIRGPGVITHIWMTPACAEERAWRNIILRIYWEGSDVPSVEVPVADFFCDGRQQCRQLSSLKVCDNPGSGLNCYWEMPFRRQAKLTLENRNTRSMHVYYQIDYLLKDIDENAMYFHAQFRRTAPVPYGDVYTVIDGVKGTGIFAGMYMLWETDNSRNNNAWIGEGEFKFYIDGDGDFPTYCGTGLEDYFCGSYNFEDVNSREYRPFSSPYSGMQTDHTRGALRAQTFFGMYRWHLTDPIIFYSDLRVTVHALGWKNDGTYLPLEDNIESVCFWYQTTIAEKFPALPGYEEMK